MVISSVCTAAVMAETRINHHIIEEMDSYAAQNTFGKFSGLKLFDSG